jgi:hypothetical protein
MIPPSPFTSRLIPWLWAVFLWGAFSPALAQSPGDSLITFGDRTRFNPYATYILEGKVLNEANGEPISRATLYVKDLGKGAITREDGSFRLKLPPGKHELVIEYLGLPPFSQKIGLYADGSLDLPISLQAMEMEEILLEAEARDRNVKGVATGVEKLNIEEIKVIPAFLGEVDVVKSLLLLPGVSTVGEGASGFNVRGGRVDQNLVSLDGGQVINPSHVLGFFSAFNPDLIQDFTLYKGHVPAQFGGRASSVLEVRSREGDFSSWRGQGGLGPVASRLVVEGPLIKEKTSLLLGGRLSFTDYLLNLSADYDIKNSSSFFYDLNAKLTHRLNENHSLYLSFYSSKDRFRFSDRFGFSWGTQLLGFRWKGILSKKWLAAFSVSYGDYLSTQEEPSPASTARQLSNGLNYLQAKQNFLFTPSSHHAINMGVESSFYWAKPERLAPLGDLSVVREREIEKQNGREFSAYLNDEIEIGSRLRISLGLRYTLYQQVGPGELFTYAPDAPRIPANLRDTLSYGPGEVMQTYGGLEPRASARVQLGEHNSLKFSYNRMRQFVHLISNTTAATPVDFWQVSNPFLRPQLSDNFSIGFFQNLGNDSWEASLELFYKDLKNLIEYKDFAELLLNPQLETALLNGEGRAYGGEFALRRTLGRWTGWLSYTYSRSLLRVAGDFPDEVINGGEWYPAHFDQPHSISLVAKRALGEGGAFSLNFVYNSGRPFTAITSSYEINGVSIPHFSDRNAFRIPSYMRVDISLTAGSVVEKWDDSLTFSIYNMLSRENAYSIFYQRIGNSFIPKPYKLSVLGAAFPAFTYNFSF